MPTLVALFRAINLGSRNRIPMADLRSLLGELGYTGARTFLQSGNAVFDTPDSQAKTRTAIEAAIAERFDLSIDVVLRTPKDLADTVAANPLAEVADHPSRQQVVFLPKKPAAAPLKALLARDFTPEQLAAHNREIHVWCPDGVQKSPILDAIGKADLAPYATVRTWRTVTKLHALAEAGTAK
jgi:uncharacterized protein (DUF1697 family)